MLFGDELIILNIHDLLHRLLHKLDVYPSVFTRFQDQYNLLLNDPSIENLVGFNDLLKEVNHLSDGPGVWYSFHPDSTVKLHVEGRSENFFKFQLIKQKAGNTQSPMYKVTEIYLTKDHELFEEKINITKNYLMHVSHTHGMMAYNFGKLLAKWKDAAKQINPKDPFVTQEPPYQWDKLPMLRKYNERIDGPGVWYEFLKRNDQGWDVVMHVEELVFHMFPCTEDEGGFFLKPHLENYSGVPVDILKRKIQISRNIEKHLYIGVELNKHAGPDYPTLTDGQMVKLLQQTIEVSGKRITFHKTFMQHVRDAQLENKFYDRDFSFSFANYMYARYGLRTVINYKGPTMFIVVNNKFWKEVWVENDGCVYEQTAVDVSSIIQDIYKFVWKPHMLWFRTLVEKYYGIFNASPDIYKIFITKVIRYKR